jgi:hypothetical protein
VRRSQGLSVLEVDAASLPADDALFDPADERRTYVSPHGTWLLPQVHGASER